jgi:hypothetical protein
MTTPTPPEGKTDAEKLRSAEITLVTLREIAERSASWSSAEQFNDHVRGYVRAMRDVLAVLDSRWLPEGAPVVFSNGRD